MPLLEMYGSASLRAAVVLVAAFVMPSLATACEVLRALSGERSLTSVHHPKQGLYPSYTTYILRNAARDANGTLSLAIVAELVPARWGFDIKSTSGRTIAMVNFDDLVAEDITNDETCAEHRIVLRPLGRDALLVLDNGKQIGTVSAFPRRLLRAAQ